MSASSKKKLRREQNAAQLTEKQLQEQKEASKLKKQTLVFTVVIALILVASIITIAVTGIGSTGVFERNTKAITIGEHTLTAAELNYFYTDVVYEQYNEWSNTYGEYMTLLLQWNEGLDLSKPFDQQIRPGTEQNWGEFFADVAVDEAKNTYALYDHAVANGVTLTEEEQTDIEETLETMELEATLLRGFSDLGEYLKAMYGRGASVDSFREYLKVVTLAQNYFSNNYDALTYEDADLREREAENFGKYSNFTYTYFHVSPSVFLECTDPENKEHTHTAEENAAALKAAEEAANELVKSGAKDEDLLNMAIKRLDAYKSNENAKAVHSEHVSYQNITEPVAEWLAEEGRKEGDIGIVPNEITTTAADGTKTTEVQGYFIVIFQGTEDNNVNPIDVRHILVTIKNGKTDEDGKTVYSDEDKAEALKKIEEIKAEFEAGEQTEDAFSILAKKKSEDTGSTGNGGLYENVYPHMMVEAFNDWCFDADRKTGDVEIVETEYGYHLMYFVQTHDYTYRDYQIDLELRAEDSEAWFNSITEPKEYKVHDLSRLNTDMVLATN